MLAKQLNSTIHTLMAALVVIHLAGCATAPCRYAITGTVNIPGELAPTPPLRTVIADAIRPLGFTGGESEHDGPYFYSLGGHGFMPQERIDLRFDPDSRQISLIDYNHSTESDFVKQVVASIERQISVVYGGKADIVPRATRWEDCLGP
jgi:hypothetical protein